MQGMTSAYAILIAAAIVLYLILLSYIVSWLDGWHRLAEQFHFRGEFEGERWRFVSGWMRWGTHFSAALTLGANQEGLYLQMLWLLRSGHPPLFIPWNEITASEPQGGILPRIRLTLGHEPPIPLWITRRMGERVLAQRQPGDSGMRMP